MDPITIKLLDKGELTLLDFMGGDLRVCAAARVSRGVTYEEASKGTDKDEGLIRFLLRNKHTTPFEHSVFQFYVKAPIFVAREWFRHRAASYNEISGRYVTFEPEFYIPTQARVPGTTNRQGSIPTDEEWLSDITADLIDRHSQESYRKYMVLLENGVAKEMSRMVLPVNLYTQFYWTINAWNLMHFMDLRSAEDAQYEIRVYSQAIEKLFEGQMPMTYKAWQTAASGSKTSA